MFSVDVPVSPLKRCLRGRRLVLVDIENVLGGAVLHEDAAHWARKQIRELLGDRTTDHIVVGISHIGLVPVGCTWTNLRYVLGSGPDGADRALLEVLDEQVESRFDEIVLISGDGIFTDKIATLGTHGMHVTVVAHRDGLAKRLRLAAHRTLYLTDHYTDSSLGGAA